MRATVVVSCVAEREWGRVGGVCVPGSVVRSREDLALEGPGVQVRRAQDGDAAFAVVGVSSSTTEVLRRALGIDLLRASDVVQKILAISSTPDDLRVVGKRASHFSGEDVRSQRSRRRNRPHNPGIRRPIVQSASVREFREERVPQPFLPGIFDDLGTP